ncbi:MAG TPA: hypothetical protein VN622_10505 [Clostridia bacterium]|nr:hypothetical protein [Clostridia bacterium]
MLAPEVDPNVADLNKIRDSIERVVTGVLQERLTDVRRDVVVRVMAEVEPALATPPGSSPTDVLNAAVLSVQDASSQTDILRALLDGGARFSQRCGLFVLRGTIASGWQARGFDESDSFRTATVDVSRGLGGRVLHSHTPASAAAFEFDSAFASRFGAPIDGNALVLPLVIKDKVAALLYCDGGTKGAAGLDSSAMELLVRTTGLWLEVLALRKTSAAESASHAAPAQPPAATAAHVTTAQSVPPPVAAKAAYAAPSTPAPAAAQEEDEAHNKARRFAKLLVDELRLYNQQKVAEGKQKRDLYDRLKDDIDKSRATYDKRYGGAITDVDYFKQELVRILADGDSSLLGSSFPG